jgi:class 3 adenylate cyclase/biotin operon repressor
MKNGELKEIHTMQDWISSIEIIDKTGISRATLNNYIKMNILPRPLVRKPMEASVRARTLGYFPPRAMDVIEQIKLLKKEGYTISVICEKLRKSDFILSQKGEMEQEDPKQSDFNDAETLPPCGKIESSLTPQKTLSPTVDRSHGRPVDRRLDKETPDGPLSQTSVMRGSADQRRSAKKPTLISFSVLAADLHDSARISAELPAGEYLDLLNQIWTCAENSFKKYHGFYGQCAGDGMLYYFLGDRDDRYMMDAVYCALELRECMKVISVEGQARKGWFTPLQLNIGLNAGREYLGEIRTASGMEWRAPGDTVRHAVLLSEFARQGAIWATKHLLDKISDREKAIIRHGIKHINRSSEVLVENAFSRIMDMLPLESESSGEFTDIASLAVTEIMGKR